LAGPSSAQVTELVSIDSNGLQENYNATLPDPGRFVSADGRFVAFCTQANNLVPGDTNGMQDIFIRDRLGRTTERVSVDSSGVQGNGHSGLYGISISADGRLVAFESASNNLVPGDTNGAREVFVHDRLSGTTERVALDSTGAQGNAASFYPSLSADGRYVAFTSAASNLVPADTNGKWDTFVRDRLTGSTERVSVSASGMEGDNDSYKPEISSDGRFVGFESNATNLVLGDYNGTWDVFVRDRLLGTTELVSVSSTGIRGDNGSGSAAVSDNGRFIAFASAASNLVPGDTNGYMDVFLRDRQAGTTVRVSISTSGAQADGNTSSCTITGNGRYVAFHGAATNLVPGDTNPASDVFVRDVRNATTERVSVSTSGAQASGPGASASISSDGRYVVFIDDSADLVPGDTNGFWDMFIHDRFATSFTSLCDPGTNNVIACPCGNAPSGPGRGCDNSSFTGGASLSASGIAYLSIDSLTFTTHDERPTAVSILLQGDTTIPTGLVFGQGVRCAGGTLKRLYVKTAVNGSITAPDLNTGDHTISARSTFLGAPIQPGQPRYYLVYYRDPTVMGGCSSTGTFNATQTGQISWWP
jgi:Tol biopolymer transport system component